MRPLRSTIERPQPSRQVQLPQLQGSSWRHRAATRRSGRYRNCSRWPPPHSASQLQQRAMRQSPGLRPIANECSADETPAQNRQPESAALLAPIGSEAQRPGAQRQLLLRNALRACCAASSVLPSTELQDFIQLPRGAPELRTPGDGLIAAATAAALPQLQGRRYRSSCSRNDRLQLHTVQSR